MFNKITTAEYLRLIEADTPGEDLCNGFCAGVAAKSRTAVDLVFVACVPFIQKNQEIFDAEISIITLSIVL